MMVRRGFLLIVLLFVTHGAGAGSWKRLMIGDSLIVRVEIATTHREQELGLGNRDSLANGTGMLFVYQHPGERIFWMKRMRFPIDIIWIRNGQIISIENRVPPPSPLTSDQLLKRYGTGIAADMVLELPAGYAGYHSITPGMTVQLAQ